MIFKLKIFVKNYNGGPKITIGCDQKILYQTELNNSGSKQIQFDDNIIFPNTLYIKHYDKNMKTDTKVVNGQIIDDKGFFLNSLQIGNILLDKEIFNFNFHTEDGKILKKNNYFGLNGKMLINVDEDNLLSWYIKLQQSFVNQNIEFDYDSFKKEIFADDKNLKLNY